jgi:hypothetical protein
MAALILLQKNAFSLNDSHAFNRADHAYPQHWQHDAVLRWNCCQKAAIVSLDLLRLHMAFIFVLCASDTLKGRNCRPSNLTIECRPDALGSAPLLDDDLPSPCNW